MVDSTGATTLARTCDPFGQVISSQGTSDTVLGYTGDQTDPSGMVYLWARYYSGGEIYKSFVTPEDTFKHIHGGVMHFVCSDSAPGCNKTKIIYGYNHATVFKDLYG